MSNHSEKSEKENKAFALLALSMCCTKEREARNCPDENEILTYYSKSMDDIKRQSFLKKIADCPESYELWIEMGRGREAGEIK